MSQKLLSLFYFYRKNKSLRGFMIFVTKNFYIIVFNLNFNKKN
jgi:hypothetical protein